MPRALHVPRRGPIVWGYGYTVYYSVEDGSLSIKCLICQRESWHPQDVLHRYCGHCNTFHRKDWRC